MGENEGEITAGGPEEKESTPSQDSLQVPAQKKKKLKSPTPSSLRGRSATPIRGRSQTPFNLYMTRRSATPSTWRSITPFLKREEKEKTPFELGRDLKSQITCNIAVFDRALIMDISEPEELQKPVRYITSDMSVIDRAAVMDVSNVEVIYVVEEYEEYEEEEEIIEEVKPKKKEKKPRKGRTPRKSMESDVSLGSSADGDFDGSEFMDREDSVDLDDDVEESDKKKPKKKAAPKKKKEEKKEKSPSPKLSLKLEIGGGQKGAKKLFEQAGAGPKPPPKKSKLAIQMEEQAKAAAKAAEEEAARAKPKGETFEEKQKRLQAEKEEEERLEAEARAQEEEEAAEEPEEAEEGYEPEDGSYQPTEMGEEEVIDEYKEEAEEASELADEVAELPEKRRGSDSSDDFIRPDPYDEERWKRIAAEDGEEFMQHLRKYSLAQRRSEKERDADWQKRREQVRLPHFINFLTDRTAEAGQSVRLACAVGGPDLSVKWFKDKRQLERDGTHRIINNNNILALEVLNTTILDSGEYSCIVANSNDEVTSSCIVTIYEVFKDEPKPPSFRFIKDYYHLRDDELTIEVHIYGVPRPVVTWWRGVFEVKPSYKYTKLEEAHGVYKLLIYKPTSKDNGIYVCKAINSQGEAQIAHTVEVTKNRHFHARGIFHARDRLQRDKELTARKAMEEALKSKAASDLKRAEEEPKMRAARASPEPLVPVKQKLSFATQLRDRMALEGTNVRFVCTVIGPQPSCRWMKDDKWVVVGPNIRNLSEEGKAILELVKVSTEASGVYKCVAKNDVSEIETSCYFKVYSAQTDGDEQEPIFALPLRDVYHSSQNDLIIDTKVRGNPRPVITWIKDDLPVVLDDRIVQIEHLDGVCELIINKPTTNDNGVYCCICENKLGSQKITHTVVIEPIHISRRSSVLSGVMSETDNTGTTKPKGEAVLPPKAKQDEGESSGYERRSRLPDVTPKQQLYFVANLSNRYVAEGSKVKLQAVIGGPDPIIKWMKDDQNVTYGPKIRNMNRDSLAVLEFLNALPEDSGKYTCMAQNEFCKISSTAELHVYQSKLNQDEPPVFVRPIKDTYHLTSNELILETGIRGQPTPEIQWFKDSIEIQNGGKYTIFQTPDGNCELIIDYPDHKDSGKYLIKAENRAGKVEIVHNVLFKGKDSHIAENIHGVYHADKSLLRPKKVEEEKPVPAPQEKPPKPDESADAAEESGKHKRGRRNTKKGDEEEEGYVSSATDYASDTGSMKKREKVIGIHFATSVRDRVVAEGSKVRISCFLEAKEPQVKWFKNDEPIVNGPKIRGRYSEGLCLLEINNATTEDSGEYRCWGRDETGEASSSCTLEVFADPGTGDVPPTFTRNIKDTLHGKLNELQLDVHVRGLPTPTVTWVKDGVKIEPNEKYQVIEHDDGTCELFVNNPNPQDSGKYVCQAENREGKTEIVHNVTVEARHRRVSPSREGRPPSKPAGENDTGDAQLEGEPSKARKKSKTDEEETVGSRREVPPPPDLRKQLYFRNFLSNRTVKSGSNVKWMVNIDGPEPTARWFHGDQPIAFGPKSKMSCQDGIAWLNLVGVTEEDSGEYTLKVRGPENEIVSTCNLFVYSLGVEEKVAPVFTSGIKDTYSLNENELVLDCRVRGKPKPEISWMKGMDLIVNDKKYQQYNEADGYSKLIISSPNVQDSGVYTCVARNEVSENKMTHQVDFKGREHFTLEKTHGFFHRDPNKPHFLAPLGNQTVCPGGTVAITAEFMQSQTPIEVNWMRDRKSVHGQPNVKTFYDRGSYTLAIMNAGPETEGTYTCRASNAFGRIESHATVDVAVGAEKEDRPPLFLSRPDNEMKIALGDPFSISFRIAGDPKPKLTFMKGTKDITKSDRVSKEVSDDYTRFTVQKSQISDSGTYFVVARNNNGTDRIFVTVTVYPRARSETPSLTRWGQPLDTFPEFTYFRDPPGPISTEPLLIDSGESHLSLSWGKPYMENAAPVTGYRVDVWVVGPEGGAFWKELGLTPINSFDVLNLKPNVEYHFRVTPKNRYGWGPSVQTKYPLQLGGGDTLPVFVSPLPAQLKALKDDQIKLECAVHGAPQPHITWYKDSLPLKCNSDRVTIGKIASKCILTLTKVCESDTGRYTCEASNCKGRSSTFTRLQVVTDQRLFEADTKLKQIVNGHTTSSEIDCLPLFTKRLRDRRAQVSHPVRFTCQILGYPRPVVIWYKNDNILAENDRYHMAEDGQFYTLEIASTTLDDGGIYTCRAQNIQGSISCHCSLVVDKGIRTYIPPEFIVPLEPVYIVKERQDIRLTARVEAYPSVAVSWNFNGIKLRQSRRILVTLDQYGVVELLIKNATLHDEGSYECTASNAVGKIENCCRVQVEPNEDYHKINACKPSEHYSKEPLFVVKPRSSEAFEGDTVIIFCEVVGDPKPEVVWLRDFLKPEYYKDAPHFQRIGDGPEYRLEIPDAKLDFTGSYSVIAKNIHGEAKAVISLQIYVKNTLNNTSLEKGTIRLGNVETLPHFVRHLKDIRCCDGDSIVLECQVEAIPEPIVIWEKDGHVICNDKEFVMFYDGVKATLSILRVFPEDEGVYTCVARNILGRSVSVACVIVDMPEEKEAMLNRRMLTPSDLYSSSTNLRSSSSDLFSHGATSHSHISRGKFHATRFDTVHRAFRGPKFLSIPQNRVVEEGESVRFQCTVSENPPTWCTWDKDGGILTPTTRIKIREVNDSRILDIENITPEDAGLYRITLKNDYGRIETTARLDVICNSRYSKSSTTTAQRISYINKRIMSPSMTMGERLALAKGYRGSSLPPIKYAHNGNYVHMTNVCFVEWHKRIIYNEKRLINFSNDLPYINQCMENSQFKNELILFKNMIMLILILNRVLDELEFWYLSHPQNTKKKTLSLIIEQHNNITAIFLGYPKFQGVRKLLQSQPMKNTNNVSVHKKDSSSSLTIRKIPADDIGKYTVESMNKWNMDSTKISVAVEGPPDPPSGKPNISLGPDHISIAWSAPPNDGGSMITGFIIEVESSEKWQELARVVDCLEYTMKNVNLNTSYRFRIIAENTHGKSAPGLPSDFVHMCLIDSKKDISSNARANGNFKSRFEILEEIGKGRFGTVFKVQDKEEPYETLAAKVIKCIKSRDHQKVREEISIMQSLNHPKLLRLEAFYETPRDITMVMEYITGGELFERVVADDFSLTELDCRLFIRQLCEGVAYMHDNFIVHLDLKPENIMCQTRETHDIKIIDFGLAQRIHTDAPVRVMFGTPEFISPEVINYEPIGLQSDMWSIGVVSYVLLSGLSPFMGDSDVDTFTNIIRADYDFDDDAFDDVSQEAKDFISNLLVHKKDGRLTAHQCLESKWLNVQNQSETLSNNKICTDKLKKFIIRRKWQKTGNAIRALGRMANLSASRRNSAILNSSMPNSPRPSISGLYIPYEMTCLHKEEDLETLEPKANNSDIENCKEHIHSDYNNTALEGLKCKKIESPTILSNAVSHDYLKSKLEDIAQQVNSETEVLKSEKIVTYKDKSQGNFSTKVVPKAVKNKTWFRTLSSSSTKELIMPSDFTNTVKMRKRTLERNISRDRFRVSKPSIETTSKGKVSFLKSKFNESPKSLLSLTNPPDANTNFNLLPRTKDSTDATASANLAALKHNSGNNEKSCCDSTANKPSSTRLQSPTTKRISDKVREVTDRLSQQTISSSARERENSQLRQSRKIHNAYRLNKTL